MKKILVPVDFSGHTETTCSYALALAKLSGGKLLLFHTYFDQIIIADSSFPDTINVNTIYNEELLKEVFHQAEKNLQGLKVKVEKQIARENLTNITVETSLAGGEIEPELRAVCDSYKPDLVVMGSTGRGKTMNVWGKVSTYIVDHAKIPVFIVPETARRCGITNIMVASDLSTVKESIVLKVIGLLENFRIKIFFTHFYQKEISEDENLTMNSLKNSFAQEEKSGLISFHMVDTGEDRQSGINQFIKDNQINLIAFQPHKHGLFYMMFTKNITKKNLFAANIPLLAVPEVKQTVKA